MFIYLVLLKIPFVVYRNEISVQVLKISLTAQCIDYNSSILVAFVSGINLACLHAARRTRAPAQACLLLWFSELAKPLHSVIRSPFDRT